jgi:hypoxanthine-DNA glycosylase
MSRIHGFPPLATPQARILILGSMPSLESLARQQYYAHPRNAFWPILSALLGIEADTYESRARQVTERGIAIWDVLRDCVRPGSLDADIDEKTAVVNDFDGFLHMHPDLCAICFNGAKAESLFLKRVLPGLAGTFALLPCRRLPSTSPANAGMSFDEKLEAWRFILTAGLE